MSQSAPKPTLSPIEQDASRTTVGAIPDWLTPDFDPAVDSRPESDERKALRHRQYASVFETVLERVAMGMTVKQALDLDRRDTDFSHFLRWVMTDRERKSRFYEAQEIGTEWLADETIEIADANESIEDVARSTLRINTRMKLIAARNSKRYGEKRQVEQTITIDLISARERADMLRDGNIIDITPRLTND